MPQALLSTCSHRRVNKLQYITKTTQIVDLNLPKSKLLNKLIDWGWLQEDRWLKPAISSTMKVFLTSRKQHGKVLSSWAIFTVCENFGSNSVFCNFLSSPNCLSYVKFLGLLSILGFLSFINSPSSSQKKYFSWGDIILQQLS